MSEPKPDYQSSIEPSKEWKSKLTGLVLNYKVAVMKGDQDRVAEAGRKLAEHMLTGS